MLLRPEHFFFATSFIHLCRWRSWRENWVVAIQRRKLFWPSVCLPKLINLCKQPCASRLTFHFRVRKAKFSKKKLSRIQDDSKVLEYLESTVWGFENKMKRRWKHSSTLWYTTIWKYCKKLLLIPGIIHGSQGIFGIRGNSYRFSVEFLLQKKPWKPRGLEKASHTRGWVRPP